MFKVAWGTAARGFLVLPYSTVDGRPALAGGRGVPDSSRTPRSEPRPGPPAAVAAFYAPPPPLPLRRSGSRSRALAAVLASHPRCGMRCGPIAPPRGAGVCRAGKCTSRTRVCVNVMRSTRKHATPTVHNSLSTPPLVSFPFRISSASHWSVPQSPHDRLVGSAPADQKSRPRVIGSLRADVGHRREPHA